MNFAPRLLSQWRVVWTAPYVRSPRVEAETGAGLVRALPGDRGSSSLRQSSASSGAGYRRSGLWMPLLNRLRTSADGPLRSFSLAMAKSYAALRAHPMGVGDWDFQGCTASSAILLDSDGFGI